MHPLRFVLMLFLTVALDLSSPVPSPAAAAIEEFEEVLHVRQERRAFRLVREAVPPSIAREIRRADLGEPRPRPRASATPPRAPVPIRRLPPPLADSPAAPEDH